MPVANPNIVGAIVVVSVVGAAAIAISQIPEVRQFGEDVRRKIAIALHNLGNEINPNPRFNRPEDAQGFMQPHAQGGEMDADEDSRRRQREELMYWNAIKLENLEKQKAKATKGPTFDDILRKNSESPEETYATKTGAEIHEDEGTLRRRGEGSRGMDRGSLYANPFEDENCLDSEGDAKMIGPDEDEIEDDPNDIYNDNDWKYAKNRRVLAAASDYPLGQHYTTQLENPVIADQDTTGTTGAVIDDYMLGLEQENRERLMAANDAYPELQSEANHSPPSSTHLNMSRPFPTSNIPSEEEREKTLKGQEEAEVNRNLALRDYQMQLMLLEQQNKKRLMMARHEQVATSEARSEAHKARLTHLNFASSPPDYERPEPLNMSLQAYEGQDELMSNKSSKRAQVSQGEPSLGLDALADYQNHLVLLEQQNYKRLCTARQTENISVDKSESNPTSDSPATFNHEEEMDQLVDVSEPLTSPGFQAAVTSPAFPDAPTNIPESGNAFASIHAWADSSNASFYSPLPGTPRALSVAPSEPERLSEGEITPTDSISLAGSGEDIGNDNASSVGGGRYDDVMSIDGGISTPGSWTEVGSVVSEDDAR